MGSAHGDLKPSILDNDEHDNSIKAKRVVTWPDNTQQRIDYDVRTDGQPVYVGYAPRGTATSGIWMIQKFTFTTVSGTDYATLRQIAYDAWTNRATTAVYS